MKTKIAVLGCGLVGRAMALDLADKFDVTVFDINEDALTKLRSANPGIEVKAMDLTQFSLFRGEFSEFGLILEAVPGFMGFDVLKTLIECGKNVVDISFFPEDAFELDEFAKEKKITAVVDCGVAPGMSNLILGYHNERMEVRNFEFMVGGLPFERKMPFQYKAPFSPLDVVEEYIRPARMVENFQVVTKEPLSEPEYIDFPPVGTLEAFNTDGLRSLIKTMHIPNMKEKTLRYPGHINLISALKMSGFFDGEEISVGATSIRPIDFSSKILFNEWKLNDDDDEFTAMRISIEGIEANREKHYVYELFDRRDKSTGISSMARTTGYTATAAVNLLADGKFDRRGIIPPEYIGSDENCFNYIINYLIERNVIYRLVRGH